MSGFLVRNLLLFFLGSGAFSIAYCQSPLYYSNQNQYFLHGLAAGGIGLLRADWLANTHDPTPVFTALVSLTARFLHPWMFHVYYALLLGAYSAAMLFLFATMVGKEKARQRWPVFVGLFLLIHSAAARWASYRFLGQDYPWFFQAGVAGQYILGAYLQPSAFGVLLVVATALFVRDHLIAAIVCVAVATAFHPSYVLHAGLLTAGFLAFLIAQGRTRQALGIGTLALVLVAPVVAHVLLVFGPTSPTLFARAQEVLVNVRIPHHSLVERWLDSIAGLQIGWIVLAMVLARKTPLFLVMAVPFVLSVGLTLIQAATGNDTLALLFPWRISAVLVPLATTIVLSRLVAVPVRWLDSWSARAASLSAVGAVVALGLWIALAGQAFQLGDEDLAVLDFVRKTKKPGDVYFLPVTVSLQKTRGSLSTDFQPLSMKRKDPRVIPIDLQRFRLGAEAPIYIDFKAIPYKDVEVAEWYERIRRAERIRKLLTGGRLTQGLALPLLRELGVTHVVMPVQEGDLGWGCEPLNPLDPYYRVYRVASE